MVRLYDNHQTYSLQKWNLNLKIFCITSLYNFRWTKVSEDKRPTRVNAVLLCSLCRIKLDCISGFMDTLARHWHTELHVTWSYLKLPKVHVHDISVNIMCNSCIYSHDCVCINYVSPNHPLTDLQHWLADIPVNPLTAKLFNLNFHPFEIVSRWRDPQLQVSENYSDLKKWRSTVFKYSWLMSYFVFNVFKRWYLMC